MILLFSSCDSSWVFEGPLFSFLQVSFILCAEKHLEERDYSAELFAFIFLGIPVILLYHLVGGERTGSRLVPFTSAMSLVGPT